MPGTAVVEVMGAEMLAQELIRSGDRATDMIPMWDHLEHKLEQIQEEQYRSMGMRGPSGPWPENTPEWQWFKFTHGMNLDLMKASEATYNALTRTTGDSVRDKTFDTFGFGVNTDQFAIWQSGYDPGTGQRFPIDLTQQDEVEFATQIMEYTLGVLSASPRTGRIFYSKRDAAGRFTPRSS